MGQVSIKCPSISALLTKDTTRRASGNRIKTIYEGRRGSLPRAGAARQTGSHYPQSEANMEEADLTFLAKFEEKVRQHREDLDDDLDPVIGLFRTQAIDGLAQDSLSGELLDLAFDRLELDSVYFAVHQRELRAPIAKFLNLWVHAFAGETDPIIKLVSTFKVFAGVKWVLRRVREACLDGDVEFLTQFGAGLAKQQRFHGNSNWTQQAYLAFNWKRLRTLGEQGLIFDLRKAGLKCGKGAVTKRQRDEIRQYVNRLGLHFRELS